MGITPFTHLTNEEFSKYVKRGIPKTPRPDTSKAPIHKSKIKLDAIPSSLDWSTLGAVTPVKNQGQVNNIN
jgi:hypothetical protein